LPWESPLGGAVEGIIMVISTHNVGIGVYIYIYWLVVSIPLKNMSSSVGMILPNIWRKNMFQTINQIYIYILWLGVGIGRWFLPIYYITHITMVVVVYPFTTGTPLPSIPILQHRLEGKMALKQPELRTYPVYAAVFTFQSPRLGETSQFVG